VDGAIGPSEHAHNGPWIALPVFPPRTTVGSLLGPNVGRRVGAMLGMAVGTRDGAWEGVRVGASEGTAVGTRDGGVVGSCVGPRVGIVVGPSVGRWDGRAVGAREGLSDGDCVGTRLGWVLGARDGAKEGSWDGGEGYGQLVACAWDGWFEPDALWPIYLCGDQSRAFGRQHGGTARGHIRRPPRRKPRGSQAWGQGGTECRILARHHRRRVTAAITTDRQTPAHQRGSPTIRARLTSGLAWGLPLGRPWASGWGSWWAPGRASSRAPAPPPPRKKFLTLSHTPSPTTPSNAHRSGRLRRPRRRIARWRRRGALARHPRRPLRRPKSRDPRGAVGRHQGGPLAGRPRGRAAGPFRRQVGGP
jgi:hypothetical protein